MNADPTVAAVLAELRQFTSERDWSRYHDPKNLAMLIASEAGELLALLRWVDNQDSDSFAVDEKNRARIAGEVADVTIGCLLLADRIGLDLMAEVHKKIERNRMNYPVSVSKGNAERDKAPRQD